MLSFFKSLSLQSKLNAKSLDNAMLTQSSKSLFGFYCGPLLACFLNQG